MSRGCAELVLLIDDNEIDTFINQKVLEFSQFTNGLLTYNTARAALDYLDNATGSRIPDLIFLDLNMPVLDGFRFLYEFSKFPDEIRQHIGIVVLSSSNSARDKEKIEVSPDVIKFLSKPLTEAKLEQVRILMEKAQYKKRTLLPTNELEELNES